MRQRRRGVEPVLPFVPFEVARQHAHGIESDRLSGRQPLQRCCVDIFDARERGDLAVAVDQHRARKHAHSVGSEGRPVLVDRDAGMQRTFGQQRLALAAGLRGDGDDRQRQLLGCGDEFVDAAELGKKRAAPRRPEHQHARAAFADFVASCADEPLAHCECGRCVADRWTRVALGRSLRRQGSEEGQREQDSESVMHAWGSGYARARDVS